MTAISVTATIAPGRRQLVNVRRQLVLTAKLRILLLLAVFAAVALTALEFLVAFLQAFVFAILTCVYLNDALHPGH